MRLDAMITRLSTRDVVKKIDDVELHVKMAAKSYGKIQIKYMSAGATTNDIKAYINELIIKTGVKPDAICIDYLDLVYPNNSKINPSDMFIKDKFVTEELRSLAAETGMLMASASQLNRCLDPNTIVTANGSDTVLRNVKIGDMLKSNGDDVEVTEILPIITQPVFRITTKSGKTITVSANHKMQTPHGLKTINTGLQVGDELISQ